MAFKREAPHGRKLQMVSLIDLIFILLIFFIISSILIRMTDGEAQLYLPTPKNEPGETQVMIQIIDADSYVWLDHTAIDTLLHYSENGTRRLSTEAKVDLLVDKMSLDSRRLGQRIERLKQEVNAKPDLDFFVLVRCPDELPYYFATNVVEKLVDSPHFQYGCVGGSIADLRASSDIFIERNVIQIEFN